jgi:2-polyprenyl-3-methyl-5-hydroxy-6-metoxy-1,4-benzoquinol methylase
MKIEVVERCPLCDCSGLEPFDPMSSIVRCSDCGYIFDSPRPTAEEVAAFYSRPQQYDSWLTELGLRELMWKRRLSKLRSTRKPGTLLDVGAGIGQFLFLAQGLYQQVHGTEISAPAIEIAKSRYGLELFGGPFEELAGRNMVFDNITLFHVLEHVYDPRATLQLCWALLAPNGILVVAVPNEIDSLRGRLRRMKAKLGVAASKGSGIPRIRLDCSLREIHLSHFTPAVLRKLLESTGFAVLRAIPDPYYVRTGISKWKADLHYAFCAAAAWLLGANLFDAMLVIARKSSALNTDRVLDR